MSYMKGIYYVLYSEYDDYETGKGWYYQNTSIKGWPSSKLFATEQDLLKAISKL